MAHLRRTWIAVALAALALPRPAEAQGGDAQGGDAQPGEEAQVAYKHHMTNGVKLFQDKNFSAAIAEFDAAYAAKPNANPLVNVALCHKARFDYPKAIAALERALSQHGDTMSAEDRAAAEAAIREMRALLAFVTVKLTPEDATLLIDGEPRAPGSWKNPIPLGPGTHRIGARAEGRASAEEQITVVSGDADKVVTLNLVANAGQVTLVATDKDTAIAVDKKPVGAGSWSGTLVPGTHLVQFFERGTLRRETQILVVAGKTQRIREGDLPAPNAGARPEDKPEPPMHGVYGLVTGGVFFPTESPGSGSTRTNTASGTLANDALEARSGGAAGVRGGLRLNNVVAFELMAELRRLDKTIPANNTENLVGGDYTYESLRGGVNLRLMTPARRARFVGIVGAGLSLDRVTNPVVPVKPNLHIYVLSETGIELDFDGVLLGLTAQQTVSSDGASLGANVRVGYGTW